MSINNVRAVGDDRPWKDEVEKELAKVWDTFKYGKISLRAASATGSTGGGGTSGGDLSAITATSPATYNAATYDIGVDQDAFTHLGTPNYVVFDTTPTGVPTAVGVLSWNEVDKTLDLQSDGITYQLGQELAQNVKRFDSSGLSNGKVVYVVGSSGANLLVDYALATSDSTSGNTFAVLTADASGGAKAPATTFGLVRNIDTSTLTEGATVWLSGTVAGGMTTTKPVAPTHTVQIGFCVRSHATEGVVFVTVQNGYELAELHDVLIETPADNEVLAYDNASSLWKNQTATEAGLAQLVGGNSFTNPQVFTAGTSSEIPATFKAATGQTADLCQWRNASNVLKSRVTASGDMKGDFAGFAALGLGATTSYVDGVALRLTPVNASTVGAIIKANAAQTANLQNWQNSAGANIAYVDASGFVVGTQIKKIGGTSAQFLKADGSVDSTTYSTVTTLDGLSDVAITTPATDQVLKYNGTTWVNAAAPGGGGGTVTSVGSGTGLTGGPITTSGTLSIDTAVVPQLGATTNAFTGEIVAADVSTATAGSINDGYRYIGMQAYTLTATGINIASTYPTARAFRVKCIGGGGGGAGCGTTAAAQVAMGRSGSGAGYAESFIPALSLPSTFDVTVGSGGSGGAAGANSGASGSFSSVEATYASVISSALYDPTPDEFVYTSSVIPPIGSVVTITGFTGNTNFNKTTVEVVSVTSTTFGINKPAGLTTTPTGTGTLEIFFAYAPGGSGGTSLAATSVPVALTGVSSNSLVTGDIAIRGGSSLALAVSSTAVVVQQMPGGNSVYNYPVAPTATTTGAAGVAATKVYGTGGAGGVNAASQATARAGAAGADGIVWIEYYA